MPQLDVLSDLITGTLRKLGRGTFDEIVTPYTEYVFAHDLFMSEKRKQQDGGYGIQRNLMVDTQGNAAWTTPYATETTDVKDVLKTINTPHRTAKTSWAFDEQEIAANNGSAEKIVDLMILRRTGAKIDLFNLIERSLISKPASSSDLVRPHGLQYWFKWVGGGAFDGGIPTGYSDVGGLSPTTYPNWKNYSDTFTLVSEDDLLHKWRQAALLTNFRPPVEIPEAGRGVEMGYYTGKANTLEFVKLTRSQNMNLGMEMSKSGVPVFDGLPIRYVPSFDDTTYVNSGSDPLYGINWRKYHFYGLSGWHMKEHPPITPSSQPTVRVMYTHCSINTICNNRRTGGFVLAKSAPTPGD